MNAHMDVECVMCATRTSRSGFGIELDSIRVENAARCASSTRTGTGHLVTKAFVGPRTSDSKDSRCYTTTADSLDLQIGRRVTPGSVSQACQHGQLSEVVEGLGVLVQQIECRVSQSLFCSVLKKCSVEKNLALGRRVHALAVKEGYESDTFLCNHIMRMYASHGRLQDAMDVFAVLAKPDSFTWSAIIAAHVKHGQAQKAIELYHLMCRSSVKPDGHVFVAALQACARASDLKSGQQVHSDVMASGVEPNLFVSCCMVDMYAKCGSLDDARSVFDGLVRKDVATWNAMISGYSQQGMGQEALRLYSIMQEEGMSAPDSVTFVCLLQACASVGTSALEKGKQLHGEVTRLGLQDDVFVANSLVNMYAKCGSLEEALRVFKGLGQKDVVTWNAIIAGYSQQGMGQEALDLYKAVQEEGILELDSVTFVCLLQACAITLALAKGRELHARIRDQGLEADVFVANSLVNMYSKCGSLEDARGVFDGLGKKNVVTWNAMISGYSQQGMAEEALGLYRAMQEEGLAAPDTVTYVCLLQACATVAALHVGRQVHVQIQDQGLQADATIGNSLINMYAKSGSMVEAQEVFDALPKRDVVTWTALMAGYTRQGDSKQVFALLCKMIAEGVQPASITFLSVLTVCSHTGLVQEGQEHFDAMIHCGVTPTVEHYTCMVDLLGRAGRLQESLALVRTMPVVPNAGVWHTLLAACRKWGNVEVGLHAYNEAIILDHKDDAAYVLMSNIYTSAQMWEQAEEMQATRIGIGAWKEPGQSSWTDMYGLVHTFLVGDKEHPESEAIHAGLKELLSKMKQEWYVPQGDLLSAQGGS